MTVRGSFAVAEPAAEGGKPPLVLALGARRKLFVDPHLVERLTGARLVLHSPTRLLLNYYAMRFE